MRSTQTLVKIYNNCMLVYSNLSILQTGIFCLVNIVYLLILPYLNCRLAYSTLSKLQTCFQRLRSESGRIFDQSWTEKNLKKDDWSSGKTHFLRKLPRWRQRIPPPPPTPRTFVINRDLLRGFCECAECWTNVFVILDHFIHQLKNGTNQSKPLWDSSPFRFRLNVMYLT